MLSPVFDRFVDVSPISVMARSTMERVLNPEQLDAWFDRTAKEQYTKDLLFSSVFDIMSQVVCQTRPSVNAAYQASKDEIGVSITSLYNKINGIEPQISAELVRYAANETSRLIKNLGGLKSSPLPGYRVKLLDGNCIEKTHHRIKELRDVAAGPLPGKSLVVYDPCLRLPIDVFPCEDGHAQERSLLNQVLLTIEKQDAWIADRNFCTVDFTCSIDSKDALFVIREHKKYPWTACGKETLVGETETGTVYEQAISVTDLKGSDHEFRRIRIQLKGETRDGDKEICLISNLPSEDVKAEKIAEIYKGRWTIETAFQHLADYLESEINTLGYPRAALFGFCVALVSYMVLSVITAALASVHGKETVDNEVSGYYVADEISGTYRGMMIALPEEEWTIFRQMALLEFVTLLKDCAAKVKLSKFQKHHRGPKKPAPKRNKDKKKPHVSTAKILAERKKSKKK